MGSKSAAAGSILRYGSTVICDASSGGVHAPLAHCWHSDVAVVRSGQGGAVVVAPHVAAGGNVELADHSGRSPLRHTRRYDCRITINKYVWQSVWMNSNIPVLQADMDSQYSMSYETEPWSSTCWDDRQYAHHKAEVGGVAGGDNGSCHLYHLHWGESEVSYKFQDTPDGPYVLNPEIQHCCAFHPVNCNVCHHSMAAMMFRNRRAAADQAGIATF